MRIELSSQVFARVCILCCPSVDNSSVGLPPAIREYGGAKCDSTVNANIVASAAHTTRLISPLWTASPEYLARDTRVWNELAVAARLGPRPCMG